jgi:hypothetical protein
MDRKQIERAEKVAQKLEARRAGQKSTPKTPRYPAAELRQTPAYQEEVQRRKSAQNNNLGRQF